jgi:hypothetical protein
MILPRSRYVSSPAHHLFPCSIRWHPVAASSKACSSSCRLVVMAPWLFPDARPFPPTNSTRATPLPGFCLQPGPLPTQAHRLLPHAGAPPSFSLHHRHVPNPSLRLWEHTNWSLRIFYPSMHHRTAGLCPQILFAGYALSIALIPCEPARMRQSLPTSAREGETRWVALDPCPARN